MSGKFYQHGSYSSSWDDKEGISFNTTPSPGAKVKLFTSKFNVEPMENNGDGAILPVVRITSPLAYRTLSNEITSPLFTAASLVPTFKITQ